MGAGECLSALLLCKGRHEACLLHLHMCKVYSQTALRCLGPEMVSSISNLFGLISTPTSVATIQQPCIMDMQESQTTRQSQMETCGEELIQREFSQHSILHSLETIRECDHTNIALPLCMFY